MDEYRRTSEVREAIRRRAHELWEAEGRPQGRHLDHWLQAELELSRVGSQANEGEGNKTAALAFDRSQTQFAREADVATYSKAAREALEGREAAELRSAEQAGRAHSHGEDPGLYQKASRSKPV